MAEQHTKTPWQIHEGIDYIDIFYDEGPGGKTVYVVHECQDIEIEDARRIVACVNACKGLTTEQLEKIRPDCNLCDLAHIAQGLPWDERELRALLK